MASPHDKTGKKCTHCETIFTKNSATFTISVREPGLVVHYLVCGPCHHKHMSKTE